MSFEEEWAALKAQAVADQQVRMQLAGTGEGDRGRSPMAGHPTSDADVAVRDDELGALGTDAFALFQQLGRDGSHAAGSSSSAAGSLTCDGLKTGAALKEAVRTWETQVKTLREACAHISNHLDYTRAAHHKNEEKIVTDMRNAEGVRMTPSRISEYFD